LKFRKFVGVYVVLLIILCIPSEQVYATTVTSNNLEIKMKFPEQYAVVSKAGIHSKDGLTDEEIQELTQLLSNSNLELVAISQSDAMEINIESFESVTSINTFSFLTDTELLEFGSKFREGILETMENMEGAENVVLEDPEIYHHNQTNFVLLESSNLDMNTYQFFTIYNSRGYRILLVDYDGILNPSKAKSFIDDINFLASAVDNPSSNPPRASIELDYEEILVEVGAGALMVTVSSIPFLYSKKKKRIK